MTLEHPHNETISERKKRASGILRSLKKIYGKAKIALKFQNNIQLLVAVILSAQCTDKKVNEVAATLFKKYKTVGEFADADARAFETEVHSCGFYRAKTRNIIAAAKMIRSEFKGKLPRTMHAMLRIPGVARKTANVVLGNAYGVVEGIAVDTHVIRFANVCGLSPHRDPIKIEKDLMQLFPKKDWFRLTYMVIDHGRASRRKEHKHEPCQLRALCNNSEF